ncbi:hypothetical protein B296_00002789 [Ensete ventricosum]|uniref:Uncharacterized protein n=1 Tax=Ensete ventricosum TaxID=4639 RepID=A0A427B1I0_ENSVE|nr:hypothetical protein B296_00002789 [Ensete ventricosum]
MGDEGVCLLLEREVCTEEERVAFGVEEATTTVGDGEGCGSGQREDILPYVAAEEGLEMAASVEDVMAGGSVEVIQRMILRERTS